MTESSNLKINYSDSVCVEGKIYSLHTVYFRHLSNQERLVAFFECLAKTILSLGTFLFSESLREKWLTVFDGNLIHVIYLDKFIALIDSIGTEQKIGSLPLEQTIKKEEIDQEHINFSDLLNRFPLEEGLNPYLLRTEDCKFLAEIVQKWNNRTSFNKSSWTVDELSELLLINTINLNKLFYLLQFFTGPSLPMNSQALTWLFTSINAAIKDQSRATMHWGVKMIWEPRTIVAGMENRFPRGIDTSYWAISNLSMFLAIEESVLKNFLETSNVNPNNEGQYCSKKIDEALKGAPNSVINTILEENRTQAKSLRFAAN